MSYRIEVSSAARHEIRALPGYVRAQAVRLIDELGEDPRPARARELRERENVYRIWLAGRWRVVYSIDDELVVVLILRVRRKEEIDYPSV